MSMTSRVKSETWKLHERAEGHPVQKTLMQGRLPREVFAANLGQLLLVHRALESRLRELRESDPRIVSIVTDEQFQEPYLLEDLAAYGVDPAEVEAGRATTELIAKIEAAPPMSVLGMHYVMEGSNNGNRFIAKAVSRAYGFEPGAPGLRYLDPYGDRQREVWGAFKTAADGAGFTEDESAQMLGGAQAMYAGLIAAFDELGDRFGIGEPVSG